MKVMVELHEGVPLIHLQLFKASKAVLEKAQEVFSEIKALAYMDGYEQILTYTKDDRMFKFFSPDKILGEVDGWKVASWELK